MTRSDLKIGLTVQIKDKPQITKSARGAKGKIISVHNFIWVLCDNGYILREETAKRVGICLKHVGKSVHSFGNVSSFEEHTLY